MPGPRRLVDWPWVVLRVECEPCRYGAGYRVARLAERYGADATLADLLERIRAKCRLIDRGHRRREPAMACAIRYRVPPGGPMPDGAVAREAASGDPWPPRPGRPPPEGRLPTVADTLRQGITHVGVHCYAINREGVWCHHTATLALADLGLPGDLPFVHIGRVRRLRCRRCGGAESEVSPLWPNPRAALCEASRPAGPMVETRRRERE